MNLQRPSLDPLCLGCPLQWLDENPYADDVEVIGNVRRVIAYNPETESLGRLLLMALFLRAGIIQRALKASLKLVSSLERETSWGIRNGIEALHSCLNRHLAIRANTPQDEESFLLNRFPLTKEGFGACLGAQAFVLSYRPTSYPKSEYLYMRASEHDPEELKWKVGEALLKTKLLKSECAECSAVSVVNLLDTWMNIEELAEGNLLLKTLSQVKQIPILNSVGKNEEARKKSILAYQTWETNIKMKFKNKNIGLFIPISLIQDLYPSEIAHLHSEYTKIPEILFELGCRAEMDKRVEEAANYFKQAWVHNHFESFLRYISLRRSVSEKLGKRYNPLHAISVFLGITTRKYHAAALCLRADFFQSRITEYSAAISDYFQALKEEVEMRRKEESFEIPTLPSWCLYTGSLVLNFKEKLIRLLTDMIQHEYIVGNIGKETEYRANLWEVYTLLNDTILAERTLAWFYTADIRFLDIVKRKIMNHEMLKMFLKQPRVIDRKILVRIAEELEIGNVDAEIRDTVGRFYFFMAMETRLLDKEECAAYIKKAIGSGMVGSGLLDLMRERDTKEQYELYACVKVHLSKDKDGKHDAVAEELRSFIFGSPNIKRLSIIDILGNTTDVENSDNQEGNTENSYDGPSMEWSADSVLLPLRAARLRLSAVFLENSAADLEQLRSEAALEVFRRSRDTLDHAIQYAAFMLDPDASKKQILFPHVNPKYSSNYRAQSQETSDFVREKLRSKFKDGKWADVEVQHPHLFETIYRLTMLDVDVMCDNGRKVNFHVLPLCFQIYNHLKHEESFVLPESELPDIYNVCHHLCEMTEEMVKVVMEEVDNYDNADYEVDDDGTKTKKTKRRRHFKRQSRSSSRSSLGSYKPVSKHELRNIESEAVCDIAALFKESETTITTRDM